MVLPLAQRWLRASHRKLNKVRSLPKPKNQVGEIRYSNGQTSGLLVPENVGTEYNLEIPQQQRMAGISISSHGLMPRYQQVPHLPFNGLPPGIPVTVPFGFAPPNTSDTLVGWTVGTGVKWDNPASWPANLCPVIGALRAYGSQNPRRG
jgi:hypothetical protein